MPAGGGKTMDNYLFSGAKVDVFQDGEKVDEGTILSFEPGDEKQTLKFKSEELRIDGILEFGSLSHENSENSGWLYLFKDPFNPLKRCFCHSGPVYHFKRR